MAEEIEKVEKAEEATAQDVQNLSEDMLDEVSGGAKGSADPSDIKEVFIRNGHGRRYGFQ